MGFERADVLAPNIPFFPCNSWMGTPGFVKRYRAFALRAAAFIEEDPDLHFRAYQTAHYPGHMTKQALAAISGGYPWYTYHAFIFERLPCFFAWITNTKVYATSLGVDSFQRLRKRKKLEKRTLEDPLRTKTPKSPRREDSGKATTVAKVITNFDPTSRSRKIIARRDAANRASGLNQTHQIQRKGLQRPRNAAGPTPSILLLPVHSLH